MLWLAAQWSWLATDRLLRDGDEEGHVGAAELFRQDLVDGHPLAFLQRLVAGDMGDYPSLYPATVGAWWTALGVGDPGAPVVELIGSAWVLLTAVACMRIAGRADGHRGPAGLAAFVVATLLPLPVGLSRHFMPEGMLVPAVALAVLAALRLGERPTVGRALALGVAAGAGLLVKQTFVFLAGPAVLAAILLSARRAADRGRIALMTGLSALATALVAGPWYLSHLQAQLAYGSASAGASGEGGLLAHALYYPAVGLLLVVGPALAVPAGVAAILAARQGGRSRTVVALAAAWLLGAVLLLSLLPKKYPRLIAPAAPAVAVLVGAAASTRRGRGLAGLAAGAGGAWLAVRSTSPPLPLPEPLQQVVPGCPQQWLRAPIDDDLGLSAVATVLARHGTGPVRVVDAPELPCDLQTSPPWDSHLSPYLRRTGQDRHVWSDRDEGEEGGGAQDAVEVRFLPDGADGGPGAGGGEFVQVPRLGGAFRITP
ncbi:MAG: glycosyltransferase family 39 protein [Alphaproteobacteria bacterium]|nr:glycosyltransferase family 39 protein [Alphaproteobacteria bacterium]